MIPLAAAPAWAAAKTMFHNTKWLIVAVLWIGTYFVGYTNGQKNILREEASVATGVVKEVADQGIDAVKQAGMDTARVKELENENERLQREFDALAERILCPLTDGELLILEGIQNSTKR